MGCWMGWKDVESVGGMYGGLLGCWVGWRDVGWVGMMLDGIEG